MSNQCILQNISFCVHENEDELWTACTCGARPIQILTRVMKRDTFRIACTIIVANTRAHSHIHPDICPASVNVNWLFGLTEDQTPRVTDSSYSNAHSLYRQVHIFTLSWLICHRGKKKTRGKKAWKVGGGNRCFRAPWGWLLTDRPDPAGPDGLGGGPQVPRRVPLALRADSCSFPWGETERKGERVNRKSAASIHVSATYTSWQGSHGARLLSAGKQIHTIRWKRKQTLVQFYGFIYIRP